jgi:hypothetical integral membrane protein (TIGR02206 family)
MGQFFAKDYTGGAFVMFGRDHWLGLAAIALFCLLIVLFRAQFSLQIRPYIRWGLVVLIYLCEGSWHVWKLVNADWSIQVMLPFWLCSVTSWTMPLLLVVRSQRYYEWAYFMGIIGATMALLTPDLMIYGFPHFRFIEYFTLHGLLVIAVVYMTAVEGFRPTCRSLPRVIVVANLYWVFCGLINSLIGSNYLYTAGKLPTPSLLDWLGPWPWYLVSMEGLGLLFCLLLYLPFALYDRVIKQKIR